MGEFCEKRNAHFIRYDFYFFPKFKRETGRILKQLRGSRPCFEQRKNNFRDKVSKFNSYSSYMNILRNLLFEIVVIATILKYFIIEK